MMYQRVLEQQALNKELDRWTDGHNVFGTLKFINGYITQEDKADLIHRKFWQSIDRTWYPSTAVKKGIRISRVCVKHFGMSGENIHYHFTAKATDKDTFIKTAQAIWQNTDKHTGNIEITSIRDRKDAYHYLAHEYVKVGSKTLDERTSHWNIPQFNELDYKNISQVRRLLKANESNRDTF